MRQFAIVALSSIAVAGFIVILALLWVHTVRTNRKLRESRELEERMKAAEEALRNSGISLVTRENQKVHAICTEQSLLTGLADYLDLLQAGKVKQWEKVVLKPKATFTFSAVEGDHRFIHTGTKQEAEDVLRRVICSVTGLDLSELENRDSYNRLMRIIMKSDSRLYVPYSSGSDGEADYRFYGQTTLAEFEARISPSTRASHID